mmetsp:Transcript_37452/g.74892  ORF Transcript_37452/g.74892 Transcript_37452/m.74892 type:complete len:260 (-) Transcript_37452:74-853(-)
MFDLQVALQWWSTPSPRLWSLLLSSLNSMPYVSFVSSPDHSSPLNTGVFLAKPRGALLLRAHECLRNCQWSASSGFHLGGSLGFVEESRTRGPPHAQTSLDDSTRLDAMERRRKLIPARRELQMARGWGSRVRQQPDLLRPELLRQLAAGAGITSRAVIKILQRTEWMTRGTWDFVNGALDQGMMWYLLGLEANVVTWALRAPPSGGHVRCFCSRSSCSTRREKETYRLHSLGGQTWEDTKLNQQHRTELNETGQNHPT